MSDGCSESHEETEEASQEGRTCKYDKPCIELLIMLYTVEKSVVGVACGLYNGHARHSLCAKILV